VGVEVRCNRCGSLETPYLLKVRGGCSHRWRTEEVKIGCYASELVEGEGSAFLPKEARSFYDRWLAVLNSYEDDISFEELFEIREWTSHVSPWERVCAVPGVCGGLELINDLPPGKRERFWERITGTPFRDPVPDQALLKYLLWERKRKQSSF